MINFGVFSPSSRLNDSPLEDAQQRCKAHDVSFHIHPQTYNQHHQSAGHGKDKFDALHDLMLDDGINAIWTSIGGNRAATILDHIEKINVTSFTKPMIGFSDITILLNALYTLTGQINIHGPCVQSLNNPRISDQNVDDLIEMIDAVFQKKACHEISFNDVLRVRDIADTSEINASASRVMIGGNLSVFQSLIGTTHMFSSSPSEAYILFLEDIGDHLSRYDRMLRHLNQTGLFEQCSAILLGDFGIIKDESRTDFGFSFEDILDEHFGHLNIPVFKNLAFGHRGKFTSLPIGAKTQLSYHNESQNLRLSFDFR
jgi:muramoyltetrapeptide carboxypeptidase